MTPQEFFYKVWLNNNDFVKGIETIVIYNINPDSHDLKFLKMENMTYSEVYLEILEFIEFDMFDFTYYYNIFYNVHINDGVLKVNYVDECNWNMDKISEKDKLIGKFTSLTSGLVCYLNKLTYLHKYYDNMLDYNEVPNVDNIIFCSKNKFLKVNITGLSFREIVKKVDSLWDYNFDDDFSGLCLYKNNIIIYNNSYEFESLNDVHKLQAIMVPIYSNVVNDEYLHFMDKLDKIEKQTTCIKSIIITKDLKNYNGADYKTLKINSTNLTFGEIYNKLSRFKINKLSSITIDKDNYALITYDDELSKFDIQKYSENYKTLGKIQTLINPTFFKNNELCDYYKLMKNKFKDNVANINLITVKDEKIIVVNKTFEEISEIISKYITEDYVDLKIDKNNLIVDIE